MIKFIEFLLIGFISGFMSGMFGIGGGSVRIPLLVLIGMSIKSAFGVNLFVIPFSSLTGAFTHRRNIEWKIAGYMIPAGIGGSILGAHFVGKFSDFTLVMLFFIVSIITVIGVHLQRIAPGLTAKLRPGLIPVFSGTFFLNLLIGLRGGSGGSLFPPFLKSLGVEIKKAIATSLFVTIFTALSAWVIYLRRGDVPWDAAIFVLLGSIAGSRTGSKLSLKTKPFWLEIGLTVLILGLAVIMIIKKL